MTRLDEFCTVKFKILLNHHLNQSSQARSPANLSHLERLLAYNRVPSARLTTRLPQAEPDHLATDGLTGQFILRGTGLLALGERHSPPGSEE